MISGSRNNHAARHYEPFWSAVLPPHFLQRGVDRVIYSIHAPGLPVLLLPFYAAAGHWGTMVFVVLLSSLVAAAVFRLAERLTDRRVAWVTWIAVALTIPFAPQSWLIFPEMPAAPRHGVGRGVVVWSTAHAGRHYGSGGGRRSHSCLGCT